MKSTYLEIPYNNLDDIKKNISFLIVTATDIETDNVHKDLKPLPNTNVEKIIMTYRGNQTYYIGVFGAYAIVHVQCGMGSVASGGAINTVRDAIDCWSPEAVVMIGIAFGIDRDKQKIGDVLVSEAVIPYENIRVGDKEIPRSPIPESGGILLNRFKNVKNWDHDLPKGQKAKFIPCHLLSGEKLIDNLEYRNKLLNAFPNAKGGEMEGAGLYAAALSKKLEWILVKGICDYADGKKSVNKEECQEIAVRAATSLCLYVFSNQIGFDDLNFILADEASFQILAGIKTKKDENITKNHYQKRKNVFVELRNKTVDFFINLPITGDISKRELLIRSVISDEYIIGQFNFSADKLSFCNNMVDTLLRLGRLPDGRTLLEAVLENAKDYLVDKKNCDNLIEKLKTIEE